MCIAGLAVFNDLMRDFNKEGQVNILWEGIKATDESGSGYL